MWEFNWGVFWALLASFAIRGAWRYWSQEIERKRKEEFGN